MQCKEPSPESNPESSPEFSPVLLLPTSDVL